MNTSNIKIHNKHLLIFLLSFILVTTVALAEDPPPLPHTFYGTITINNGSAPAETVIIAKINDQIVGTVITTQLGSYGSQFNDPTNLIVQGITDGTIINFYIEGVDTEITYSFLSGSFTELNLSVDIIPAVIDWSPTGTNVAITTNIVVTFNESMNISSVQNAFSISPSKAGIFSWGITNKTITFNPDTNLAYGTTYTVTISKTAEDIFGVNLTDDFSWFFKTRSKDDGGPGPAPEPPTNQNPIADAGGPYTGFVDAPITFDGSGSSDSDGTITNYTWDFGDNTIGYGVNPTHIYSNIENYTVNLHVKDDVGATDTDTTTVTINGVPPVADANGPYVTLTYKIMEFDGTNSYDTDGTITNYTWNLSGGTILYGEKPTHTYTEVGTYNITLKVTDNHNLTSTDTTTVTVILDSDGDGLSDEIENIIGSNPNEETSFIILEISGVEHYLIDIDNDGQYDTFYNSTSKITTTVELKEGKYLIDDDGDGTFDYIYNPATGEITPYQPEEPGEIPWIYITAVAIIIIFIVIAVVWYVHKK